MLLSPYIEISRYNHEKYVLYNGQKRYFVISEDLYRLVRILENSATFEEAYESYKSNYGINQTYAEFKKQIHESLSGKDILLEDGEVAKSVNKRRKSVYLRITFIPTKLAGIVSRVFSPLYDSSNFFFLFSIFLVASIFFLSFYDKSVFEKSINGDDILYAFTIFVLSTFLHELGHISACKKFGGRHGGIGIGLYLILPVFWADIHGVWMLPKKERVIANLAGIYIQLLLSFLLIIIYLVYQATYLLYSAYLISSAALFQLWPFIRLDGYWCVSDLTNTPKLTKVATGELKLFLKRIFSKNRADYFHSLTPERIILVAYSASFFLFIIVLIALLVSGF